MRLDFINNDFWRIEESSGNSRVIIDKPKYFEFLEKNGFGKIYMDGDSIRPTYVRVKDNVARIVSRDTMITFSRSYIRERVADSYIRNQVYDAFIGSVLSKPESA